jgi:hypothetical protein
MLKKEASNLGEGPVSPSSSQDQTLYVEQIHALQQALGNQAVNKLIEKGALHSSPSFKRDGALKDPIAKTQQEVAQRNQDTKDLQKDIKRALAAKEEQAKQFAANNPESDIFFHVELNYHYAKIPGLDDQEYYHQATLNGVSLSTSSESPALMEENGPRQRIEKEILVIRYSVPEPMQETSEEPESDIETEDAVDDDGQLEEEIPELDTGVIDGQE